MASSTDRKAVLADFYDRVDDKGLVPLWVVLGDQMTQEPETPVRSHLWRYDEVRPDLIESGELMTAEEADRRVLVLKNPGLDGRPLITQSLQSGVQLILPGEIAPAHRHTQSALRFIFEGSGAHTAVDGERVTMHPGDLVLTPNWSYHDHGNESDEPMIWLDGLDVGLVMNLGTIFAEQYPSDNYPVTRSEGNARARYGAGMTPIDHRASGTASPLISYPYEKSRETLEHLKTGPVDSCHGIKLKYTDPLTGDHVMPTLGAFLQLLPKGFRGAQYRSTDATVFTAVEGRGRTVVGGRSHEWTRHDVFVVPTWVEHHHEADTEAILFSFSDRPAQEKLALWRESRGSPH